MSEEKEKLNEVGNIFKEVIKNDPVLNGTTEEGKRLGRQETEEIIKKIIQKARNEKFTFIYGFGSNNLEEMLEQFFRDVANYIAKLELTFAKYIEEEIENLNAMKLVFGHVSSGTHRQISYRADLFTEILIKRLEMLKGDPKEMIRLHRIDLYELTHGSLSFAKIKAENYRLKAENESLKKQTRADIVENTDLKKLFD